MPFCNQCGHPTTSGTIRCADCSAHTTSAKSSRLRRLMRWGAVLAGSVMAASFVAIALGTGALGEPDSITAVPAMGSLPAIPIGEATDMDIVTNPDESPAHDEANPQSPVETATTTTTTSGHPLDRLVLQSAVAPGSSAATATESGDHFLYGPMNAIDGLAETWWRVPGDSEKGRLQVLLAGPAEITGIRILPGDGVVHSQDGANPQDEDHRIRVVQWTVDDGSEFIQELSPTSGFQFIEVDEVVSTTVVFEILASIGSDGNDYIAIAEIEVYGRLLSPADSAAEARMNAHVFPLDPPSAGSYSPGGHGYPATDIFAPEGTPFVAVTSGVVDVVSVVDIWDPEVNDGATRGGLYVGIIGDDGIRYYGSHLSSVTDGLVPGIRVVVGQLLGTVGSSGNARETTPHLHFGISAPTYPEDWQTRRGQIDPVLFLDAWRRGETDAAPSPES